MGEEEASAGIVGVSIGLRVLVMDPVVPRPLKDVILESHGVGGSQKYPQRQLGLVGPVAPQAMGTSCHTQSSQEEAEVGCKTQGECQQMSQFLNISHPSFLS